ncbi:MAG: peroxide stress protein YaaA [Gammaproteobacteria bacterium]|nr:peroxide stress protein YaaA [Gammaproteobacteria bacterium]MYK28835.1 peroxide stress protein YaaA [Gammaproteobacteria bacterium]
MLAIISPAKSLDFDGRAPTRKSSVPSFLDDSAELIRELRELAPQDLSDLMGISTSLAELNYDRYATWGEPFNRRNAKQAMFAFNGDVYMGLKSTEFSERDLTWAQKHLRILSGLHGILKPLDLIQPYRLEMGTRLPNERGDDLYDFWRNKVTEALNDAIDAQRQPVLVNLASNEYFNAVDTTRIDARIITPTFKDLKNGRYKFISFFAKKARGLMAAYLIKNRVSTMKALKAFDWQGYRFSPAESSANDWVFLRDRTL